MANNFSGDANCVALWKFDNDATDSKGENDLTPVNSPTYDSGDKKEGTHSADLEESSTQYFTIDDGDLDAGFPGKSGTSEQSFSICLWVKPESFTNYTSLAGKFGASGHRSYSLTLWQPTGRLFFQVAYNNGANYTSIEFETVLETGKWYHIAAVYDSSDNSMKLRVWDDDAGTLLDSNKGGTAGGDMSPSDAPLEIGRYAVTDAYALDGRIDEVVIFKDVLSDAEIDKIRAGTYGDEEITVPLSAIDVAVNAPTMVLDRVFDVPLSEITSSLNAPTIVRDRIFAVPLSAIDAAVYAPGVGVGTEITVPLSEISTGVNAPTLVLDRIFAIPLSEIDAALYAPTITGGATVIIPLIEIDTALYVPDVTGGATVIVPLSEIDVAANAPTLIRDIVFDIPLASIDAAVNSPSLIRDRIFDIPLAEIDSAVFAPEISVGINLSIPLVEIDTGVLTPSMVRDCIFAVPLSDIDVAGIVPEITGGAVVIVPLSEISVALYAPGLDIEGRRLKVRVITSQYRLVHALTSHYRNVKAHTAGVK
jgi:hypothetical protein